MPTADLAGVDEISAAGNRSLARIAGAAYGFGFNSTGQLGDGTTIDRFAPVQVKDPPDLSGWLTNVARIAASGTHSVALLSDGTVRAWGENTSGQLGDGTFVGTRLTPVKVKDPDNAGWLTGVKAIAAGGGFSLALLADDSVVAWGLNSNGQLGDGTTTNRSTPAPVVGLTGVTRLAAGGGHSLALLSNGTLRAWGGNAGGQLGDGTTEVGLTIVAVADPSHPTGFLTGVTAIAAGGHSLALLADGSVRAWGATPAGQIGDGVDPDTLAPVHVEFPKP